MINTEVAKMAKQHLKILKAFQTHLNSNIKLLNLDSHFSQWIICELKTKEMRKHVLTKIEKQKLLHRPDPFQPYSTIGPGNFHFEPSSIRNGDNFRKKNR